MDPALTDEQRDGLACVRCGSTTAPMRPVDTVAGVQVFACTVHDHLPAPPGPPRPVRQDDGMDLVEFLRARLDKDERVAREAIERTDADPWSADPDGDIVVGGTDAEWHLTTEGSLGSAGEHIARHDPARVLAEVEAKRGVIAKCEAALCGDTRPGEELMKTLAVLVLEGLATAHADHSDFREEWRP